MCGTEQVVQFQNVAEGRCLDSDAIDIARASSGQKWVYVGNKRTHTHDVRALAIATPIVASITSAGTPFYVLRTLCFYF